MCSGFYSLFVAALKTELITTKISVRNLMPIEIQ
jgi:hypothetical protein